MNTCSSLFELKRIDVAKSLGLGPAKSKALVDSGFEDAFELIHFFPRRYVDRRNRTGISDAAIGQDALVLGVVRSVKVRYMANRREIVEVNFGDDSGSMLVTFFNQAWRKRQLSPGLECALFGKMNEFRHQRQMVNPLVDLIGDRTGRIVPIYPMSEKYKFKSGEMPRFVAAALSRAGEIVDPIPAMYTRDLDLISRSVAYRLIHEPATPEDIVQARSRLAFDELFRIQLHLVAAKVRKEQQARGVSHRVGEFAARAKIAPSSPRSGSRAPGPMAPVGREGEFQPGLGIGANSDANDMVSRFLASLPFAPTAAQMRVIGEIALDMASKVPMHRLLQGDVGAGKTVVAVCAALFGVQSGYQAAIMAPTEVLAEQHFLSISRMLNGLDVANVTAMGLFEDLDRPIRVELLTNKVTGARRQKLLSELGAGEVDVLIGTHALLSEGVGFSRLGVAVIDEQHRFGVEQRSVLRERALLAQDFEPDVLVMTATPIPRTAAMTIFGDLDYSVLDELPPGRTPILTRWANDAERVEKVYDRLKREVAAGRQAYVICPLVEDSEKIAAASAVATYEELGSTRLAGLRLGLLHGQLPTAQKASVMEQFRRGEVNVLVATTVIEVGVDVPNATVMVILDAARFGIAQIHQLRGRVGRASLQSWCYLIETGELEANTAARIEACVESTDGFFLAERDLELRGEGTLLGARQKGSSDLRIASLAKDKKLLVQARQVARAVVGSDPALSSFEALREEMMAFLSLEDAEYLFRS